MTFAAKFLMKPAIGLLHWLLCYSFIQVDVSHTKVFDNARRKSIRKYHSANSRPELFAQF